jgi:hypothetical protein
MFNLYSEMNFRSIEGLSRISVDGYNVNNMRYADNTDLIANSELKNYKKW